MSRVLVTGASGFVGRALVPHLGELGVDVVSVGRPGPDAVGAIEQMADAQPDVIVHLATMFVAEHQPEQIPDVIRTNVEFGTLVNEAALRADATLVSIGSSWQHYEGRAYDPVSLYAATKQALSDITEYYVRVRGLKHREVVLFDTYGPGDPRPKLVPSLLAAARSGEPLPMSDGEQLIDLTYIDDVAAGIAMVALDADALESSVLRTWQPLSVRDVVAALEAAIGRPVPVQWGVRPSRPREMRSDWVFGASPSGWIPRVELVDGLQRTWAAT